MKHALYVIIGALVCPIGVWLGGYDFDTRGLPATLTYIWSICFGFCGHLFFKISEIEK